jgi:hypothetical protein
MPNKRIAKKRATPSFWTRITVEGGETIPVHVNRRGCKGPWTKADDDAMQALVRAAHEQFKKADAARTPLPSTES